MQVIFKGNHNSKQAAESLVGIVQLLKERYGIMQLGEMQLNITLMDDSGEEVELVDLSTSEVLNVFEVYESSDTISQPRPPISQKRHLRLVIDNTK